jgi:hypothetical protein
MGFADDRLDPLFANGAFERMSIQPFGVVEQPAQR